MKKKINLKENNDYLEQSINIYDQLIDELKINNNKIKEYKEELKGQIQIIFSTIRNELNEREKKLLSDLDEKFKNIFIERKKFKKLKNKIKIILEKSRTIEDKNWNNINELPELIDICLEIENNRKKIDNLNDDIKKSNSDYLKIRFRPEKYEISEFIEKIQNFGNIYEYGIIIPKRLPNKEDYQPIINTEIKPIIIDKMIQPIIHKEIQPIIHKEIQPIIHKEIQPVIRKEIQPIIHKEIQPVIRKEIQPVIRGIKPNIKYGS